MATVRPEGAARCTATVEANDNDSTKDRRGTSAAYVVMQRDTEAGSNSERVVSTGKVVSAK